MDELTRFRFRIDGFTPDTMPMARLAEYLGELARLAGEREHVHFESLHKGSAQVIWKVDHVAVPKVRDRLREADMPEAPLELARPKREINRMLALDNCRATLREGRIVVMRFPGRDAQARIGPVVQDTDLIGRLVRVGGRRQPHATLEGDNADAPDQLELTEELARRMAPYLYGAPIRVWGAGHWYREPTGEWTLGRFRAVDFEELRDESLRDTVTRLREVEGSGWRQIDDPFAELRRMRTQGEESGA